MQTFQTGAEESGEKPLEEGVSEKVEFQRHVGVQRLIDAIAGFCASNGVPLDEVVSPETARKMHLIAHAIDDLKGRLTVEDVRSILAEQGLDLRGKEEAHAGFYVGLQKCPQQNSDEKPGYLTFAYVPRGHTAPTHTHLSPRDTDFPGEIAVTVAGTSRYVDQSGNVSTMRSGESPRISLGGSVDNYLKQEGDDWGVFYIQFRQCKLA